MWSSCVNIMESSSSTETESWRGVPMTEILGAQSPWSTPEFPMVSPSHNHTVLYHVPSNSSISMDTPPKPQIGQEKWDHEFVRMPFSSKNLYPVDEDGETKLKKRWTMIQDAYKNPIRNSQELANAILSYNSRNKWKFFSLHKLFRKYIDEEEARMFFDVTLPEIIKLALALPKLIQSPIPLLRHHKNHSITLSQQQIASLLANAFLCTFPRRNHNKRSTKEYTDYPNINFSALYEASAMASVMEKLKCICHYFRRVCTQVPVGVVTFSRRHVGPARRPRWPSSGRLLGAVPIHVDSVTTIEDAYGLIQFDFANKFLGGGVLGHGCVQEEIRFVICPELIVSMLFTEMMQPDEALMMIGCERYSDYTGYGNGFQFSGDHRDPTPRDGSGRRRCAVLAVDAMPFRNRRCEYQPDNIERELDKAWVGVSFDTEADPTATQHPGVATGNWGCGAFGGTPRLKALLQLAACAQARRPMAYYTFGDDQLRDDIVDVYNVLTRHNVTVGQLFEYLVRYAEQSDATHGELYPFLQEQCSKTRTEPTSQFSSDVMDISNTDESLSNALEQEFFNSPELFSQEETTEPEPKAVPETKTEPTASKTETKSTLFDKMQELDDEESCKLNFSNSRHSVKRESTPGVDVTIPSADSPKHVKKKPCNKITDYFSKSSS